MEFIFSQFPYIELTPSFNYPPSSCSWFVTDSSGPINVYSILGRGGLPQCPLPYLLELHLLLSEYSLGFWSSCLVFTIFNSLVLSRNWANSLLILVTKLFMNKFKLPGANNIAVRKLPNYSYSSFFFLANYTSIDSLI